MSPARKEPRPGVRWSKRLAAKSCKTRVEGQALATAQPEKPAPPPPNRGLLRERKGSTELAVQRLPGSQPARASSRKASRTTRAVDILRAPNPLGQPKRPRPVVRVESLSRPQAKEKVRTLQADPPRLSLADEIPSPKATVDAQQSRVLDPSTRLDRSEPRRAAPLHPDRHFYLAEIPNPYPTPSLADTMADSSSTSNAQATSTSQAEGASTVKQKKGKDAEPKEPKYLDHEALENHNIMIDPIGDGRIEDWKQLLDISPLTLAQTDITGITKAAQDFLANVKGSATQTVSTDLIDGLCFAIDKAKSSLCHPIIHKDYFRGMLQNCTGANEAVLQHSLMMSVFHTHWIPDEIIWNAEGAWNEYDWCQLRSRDSRKLKSPKPDLAFSFKKTAFSDKRHVPHVPNLFRSCLSPDGATDGRRVRYFPFLFIEVKKSKMGLEKADLVNLNTASKALHNIYLWMEKAGMKDRFYSEVRVFSIALNAMTFNIRIHRAEWDDEEQDLAYYFDNTLLTELMNPETLMPEVPVTRDRICRLVNKILKDYGTTALLPVLKEAFDKVCNTTAEVRRNPDNVSSVALATQNPETSEQERPGSPSAQLPLDDLEHELLDDSSEDEMTPEAEEQVINKRKSTRSAGRTRTKRNRTAAASEQSTSVSFDMGRTSLDAAPSKKAAGSRKRN